MGMKEAFETFFEEMTQNYIKKKGCPPKAPCNEERVPTGLFLIDTLNENGYAQWNPILQDKTFNFDAIEKELGLHINEHIKQYLSTYWFLPLDGRLSLKTTEISNSEAVLRLIGITRYTDIFSLLKSNFNREGTHYLSDANYFLLGTYCMIDGVDSFIIVVNNESGEVTAVDVIERISVHLSNSIEELLLNMKGIWKVK